jgi:hypothetical protein
MTRRAGARRGGRRGGLTAAGGDGGRPRGWPATVGSPPNPAQGWGGGLKCAAAGPFLLWFLRLHVQLSSQMSTRCPNGHKSGNSAVPGHRGAGCRSQTSCHRPSFYVIPTSVMTRK